MLSIPENYGECMEHPDYMKAQETLFKFLLAHRQKIRQSVLENTPYCVPVILVDHFAVKNVQTILPSAPDGHMDDELQVLIRGYVRNFPRDERYGADIRKKTKTTGPLKADAHYCHDRLPVDIETKALSLLSENERIACLRTAFAERFYAMNAYLREVHRRRYPDLSDINDIHENLDQLEASYNLVMTPLVKKKR